MKKYNFLFLTLLITSMSFAQDKRLAGLDTFARRILKERNAPGVSIAVVEKNKVIFAGGFGYRDVENKLPVTENTLFAIGSCTKAFTGAILGMLEKEGKVNLDKPVRDYLPELKFSDEYANDHITLRDMLSHRTGLPRHDAAWYGSTATRSEILDRIQYLDFSGELREKWQYNNLMYMALGMVIEKVTGKSWEENMRERILMPLGMNHSNLSVTDMEKIADRSLAYEKVNDSINRIIPYRNIDVIGPAGSVNSCASDMTSWLMAWINTGKFNGKEIFPASYRNQAISVQMVVGSGLPGTDNPDIHLGGYGFGWGMSSYRGHYRVDHTGGIDGFSTVTSFFPSDSVGIFIVSAQSSIGSILRNFIAERMLGLSYINWGKQQLDALARSRTYKAPNTDSLNRIIGTNPSHPPEAFTGTYENKGYGQIRIFIEKDTLWFDYNEAGLRTKSWLQHYHYDVFRLRSTDELRESFNAQKIRFITGNNGKIISLETSMEPAVKDIIFEKQK